MNDETHAAEESPIACDVTAVEPGEGALHAANTVEL